MEIGVCTLQKGFIDLLVIEHTKHTQKLEKLALGLVSYNSKL